VVREVEVGLNTAEVEVEVGVGMPGLLGEGMMLAQRCSSRQADVRIASRRELAAAAQVLVLVLVLALALDMAVRLVVVVAVAVRSV
jgi:hypothetical protein